MWDKIPVKCDCCGEMTSSFSDRSEWWEKYLKPSEEIICWNCIKDRKGYKEEFLEKAGVSMEKMTKQEEIREGIARGLSHNDVIEWEELTEGNKQFYFSEADRIRNYLQSQDVVIKVERELPEYHHPNYMILGDDGRRDWDNKKIGMKAVQQDMLKAGFGFFESLVEEVREPTETREVCTLHNCPIWSSDD